MAAGKNWWQRANGVRRLCSLRNNCIIHHCAYGPVMFGLRPRIMTGPMAAHCAPVAGPQCCSQTPIHTRIKQQCPPAVTAHHRARPALLLHRAAPVGDNPSNMRLGAAGCTSPTMVANDRDSAPGQFQSLFGCASPLWGSNPRPYAHEAHALPAELRRHGVRSGHNEQ